MIVPAIYLDYKGPDHQSGFKECLLAITINIIEGKLFSEKHVTIYPTYMFNITNIQKSLQ